MAKKQSAFAAFDKDSRFNKNGVPIVFYLKKISTGLLGEKKMYVYYNHHRNIQGQIDTDDRDIAKRKMSKEIKMKYPKLDIDIRTWR